MALTYELVGSTTLGSNAQTLTVSSIPTTYTNLVVTINASFTGSGDVCWIYFNGETSGTNYYFQLLGNVNNTYAAAARTSNAGIGWWNTGIVTNWSNSLHMEIPQYKNTGVSKNAYVHSGNSEGQMIQIVRWASTSAINSIQFSTVPASAGYSIAAGTQLNVWGIKGA
jgi:hypothetical protein